MTITRHHEHTPDTLDAEEVFRFLGYNPSDPAARAVVGLCLRYQLDPFAGHIIVIQGRRSPYVTRDGHLYLAHASGQLDGIEVLEEWVTDKNCHAKVAVWRKDMGRAFIYTGRAPLKRGNGWDEHADKKAVANAEVRALKRAFPLQLPSIVDYEDDLEAPESPPVPNAQEAPPTEAGRARDGGPNHARPERDAPPPGDAASTPPGPTPPGPGGSKRSRSAEGTGKPPAGRAPNDDAAEQAAFEQAQADGDPGRFAR